MKGRIKRIFLYFIAAFIWGIPGIDDKRRAGIHCAASSEDLVAASDYRVRPVRLFLYVPKHCGQVFPQDIQSSG